MDFLTKIFSSFSKKEVNAAWQPFFGGESGLIQVSKANLMDNNKNWVYVCTDRIADHVSSITLKLMQFDKQGKDVEVLEHPALDLLDRPNAYMSGRDFRYSTVAHEELTGNAYWLKDNAKSPKVLFPLNPKHITPVVSADLLSITGYKYQAGMKSFLYSPDLIFHLKYPNPNSPLTGRGTLEPMAEWVDVDNAMTEFNRRFFQNGASLGGIITTEATSKEAQEQYRLALSNQHAGVRNAFKWMILPKGTEAVESTANLKDMQFNEGDNRFRDKILAGFGVPKSVIGLVEDVNRANAETSTYVFMALTIKPKMDRFVTFLNEFYLPTFDKTGTLYFTYDDPVPENVATKLEEYKAGLAGAGWLTINEVRGQKGLPTVANGDDVLAPLNLLPIGMADPGVPDEQVEPSPTDQNPPAKGRKAPRKVPVKHEVTDKIISGISELFKTKMTRRQAMEQHAKFVSRVTPYELKFKKIVKDHDQKQSQIVLNNLKNIDLKKRVSRRDLFDKQKQIDALVEAVLPLFKDLAKSEGEQAISAVNKMQVAEFLKKDFDITKRILDIITASVKRMARSYTQTTLNILTEKINTGISDGDSIPDITASVAETYDYNDTYRASRVARTEVFSAANDASREAYIQSDVVETVKWVTAEDELTCEFCGPLDGTIVGVEDGFFDKGTSVTGSEGGSLSLDYENVQNPPLHPNCRCFLLPETISVKSIKSQKPVKEEPSVYEDLKQLLDNES